MIDIVWLFQLLDLPGIIEGAKDGKGRGKQVIAGIFILYFCFCSFKYEFVHYKYPNLIQNNVENYSQFNIIVMSFMCIFVCMFTHFATLPTVENCGAYISSALINRSIAIIAVNVTRRYKTGYVLD